MYEYPDYLMHHGVKGMKWGVRKKTTDATQVSKRKLKKQMVKANRKPDSNKNTKRVSKEFNKKVLSTKEGKAYSNTVEFWAKMNKIASDQGGRLTLTKEQAEHFKSVQDAYEKKGREMYNTDKVRDQFASAALKDLGYDDTRSGRDYIKKLGLI